MKTARVVVLPYDADWKTQFEEIQHELDSVLSNLVLDIHHVGSTSVRGMWAKPCIDIDVEIEDDSCFDAVVKALATIGYFHEGDLGIQGREAFGYLGKEHLQKHHLYVCVKDSEELRRHLTFRDYLRKNPDALKAYSEVKEKAARLYPDDIDGYMAYKSPCIEALYKKCGLVKQK